MVVELKCPHTSLTPRALLGIKFFTFSIFSRTVLAKASSTIEIKLSNFEDNFQSAPVNLVIERITLFEFVGVIRLRVTDDLQIHPAHVDDLPRLISRRQGCAGVLNAESGIYGKIVMNSAVFRNNTTLANTDSGISKSKSKCI